MFVGEYRAVRTERMRATARVVRIDAEIGVIQGYKDSAGLGREQQVDVLWLGPVFIPRSSWSSVTWMANIEQTVSGENRRIEHLAAGNALA